MIGPPERKSPARTGILPGSKAHLSGGGLQETGYTDLAEKETAVCEIDTIAFWLSKERIDFRSSWEAPLYPEENVTWVCFGNLPNRSRFTDAIWLWHSSGYLREVGIAHPPRGGQHIAERLAALIPNGRALDCRADYERMAA